ncbi:MAG TPA: TRZ/ATZ family protein [Clostridiales bacterium]|nr:TRZ/ATZ family protein [Clostridiales bacterium]
MNFSLSKLDTWKYQIKAGDRITLTGTVYTARDAAHLKLCALLDQGEPLPFDLQGTVIYYAGPAGTPPGKIIGSCGPTTSARMSAFVPRFLSLGIGGIIGKGEFPNQVKQAFFQAQVPYFSAVGGAGARIADSIKTLEVVAFPALGCESVKKLYVEKMPVFVAYDLQGNDIYACAKSSL